jgi:hypothetical protein
MIMKISKELREYFKAIGSKGGKKSKRKLTSTEAREMVRVREAKRKGRS